ncbi:MOSC domain-containing protein YiiM [Granulicella rosea]|uniref:MOSC domain-containing protein YiiM n=1 Tax=Granulicella rosea TaxID=474952 RepID=A0A239GZI4_9BACT|nr:MOSC domain-containing protein [Granulicella rosea]SNS74547.1 MOSC domain-containing protein YiiM [Granulicella rosea]
MSSVIAVSLSPTHSFSKSPQLAIRLIENYGVEGDAHAGALVKHRYRVRKDPTAPNLCQVHLIHAELFDELRSQGLQIGPGEMGENITTAGVDLLSLPVGALISIGAEAVVEVTGLRDPCNLMNDLQPGLMKACIARDADGELVRKAGIMGTVLSGGEVRPGDSIRIELPPLPHRKMGPV